MAGKTIGILALQGAFIEHEKAILSCGAKAMQVRTAEDLEEIDGLIIPGGESTTIGKLMVEFGLLDAIKDRYEQGMAIWGTCAGMILLAKELAEVDQAGLNLMDMRVRRNAYGRQVDSFETELDIDGLGKGRGVFIRAPYVEKVWGKARVLSSLEGNIVMVQQDRLLASSFHPELTDDTSIHEYFLKICRG